MPYLDSDALKKIGFKSLGKGVKISDKAAIYNPEQMEIGDFSRVDDFCVLSGQIKIGRNVHIAPMSLIAGGEKGITLSDFSGLAYHVQIFTQSDDYSGLTLTNPTVPKKYKRERKLAVYIGRHVIIGAGSIVFPGVHLADGCSVGAMSLVHQSTESWGVYVGNPAKRVSERRKKLLELEQQYLTEADNNGPL
mgnify:CR=1 FL=1